MEYYLKGTVSSNDKMDLTMMHCTHKKAMRDDGLSTYWSTPCKVTTVTDKSISGSSLIEWYQNDYINGKEVNFKRDASRDFDRPFKLTRTDCKTELEDLVAEIDRLAEVKKEMEGALEDVGKSLHAAKDVWEGEVRDQLKEEIFHGVVPPVVKILPQTYDQDPGSYVESWADFVAELGKSGGNWALEKAGKIVLLWDLFIDWGNVIAKGLVTLDEMDQINNALVDMGDQVVASRRAWVNAMIEYEKLRQLCASEIPLDQQPKPKVDEPFDKSYREDTDRLREEMDNAEKRKSSAIQSAKTELSNTAIAVKDLGDFLEPFRNADKNKTMNEVMTAAGIIKLQTGFMDAGKKWINVFNQFKAIEENQKKLKELSNLRVI